MELHTEVTADRALRQTEEAYLGIVIDHSRSERLTDQAKELLANFYMRSGENFQHGFARACVAWATYKGECDFDHAQRLYKYASTGWFGFASPVLSNAPLPGEKPRGLPISCFAGYVPDTLSGLIDHSSEFRWLSVNGGGVGGHWEDVRSVSDKAPGPVPFIRTMDADAMAYKQGRTRKGSYVAYLSIRHPDVLEFAQLRVPSGDANRKCLGTGFHNAVNITDDFMEAVLSDSMWDLVDPHDNQVRETVRARELWESLLDTRMKTGEPYLNFIDTAQAALPEAQKLLGLQLHGSNLCNEIHQPTGIDYLGNMRTFVCCLSSVNAELKHEWEPYADQFIGDLIRMLDNVLEYFIENAPDELANARYSAIMERALGLGAMGVHALIQRNDLAWESKEAVELDRRLHEIMENAAKAESLRLGAERGEAPDMRGTGYRNSQWMADAPTANNASIVGTSPGIELWAANAFAHRTRVGTHLIKNGNLEVVLERYGMNTDDVWQSILLNNGSVQHLDFLSAHEKRVYKTAIETDMMWVIRHAAARQKHISQGQSLNVFFPPGTSRAYFNRVHLAAWDMGCKGLYYVRTQARNRADSVSTKIERVALQEFVAPAAEDECLACQG